MTRRNRRPHFNGSADDHAATEQWLSHLHTEPADGTTHSGTSDIGVMADAAEPPVPWRPAGERFADPRTWRGENDIGIMAIATFAHPAPLDGYRPQPASFPALPPGPVLADEYDVEAPPVLRAVPVTEPAVIGDELRLPVIWCDMPGCIGFFLDEDAAGFADARDRAAGAGWRTDALARLACPQCQQGRADYRTPQPVTWHHPEVARRWHERGQRAGDDTLFRLEVEAELGRRVSREDPPLARAIAGATHRTAAS